MPQILLEDTCEFIPRDRTKISEALKNRTGAFPLSIPGRLSVCDSVNGNKRRYPKKVWEKNVADPKSPLQERISKHAAFGLLEHPKDGKVDLTSPITHLVTKATMEGNEVHGEITLVNTAEGLKLTALIEAGYNPLVSSRGYGTVVRTPDGIDEVQDDFVCESWDVVHTPSFANAELFVPRNESGKSQLPRSTVESAAATASVAVHPILTEATPAAVVNKQPPPKIHTMDIKTISESVQSLRAMESAKLDPARFAEGIARIHQIHRDVAALVAEDSKSAWDGTRLHSELDSIEKSWIETLRAPVAEVTQLREQQIRTLKVVKAVAETGLKLKTQLGEARALLVTTKTKIDETLKRGKGWMERALKAEKASNLLEHKFDVSCTALDIMTERYHADTAALGRRVLTLEFRPTDEVLLKRIKEAKNAKELAAIREELKPKTTTPVTETTTLSADGKGVVPPADGKTATTTTTVTAATPPVTTTESKKSDTTTYIAESTLNRPFTVAESLQVGRDLSKTA